MDAHVDPGPLGTDVLHVSLSRRNLKAFLALLDSNSESPTIIRMVGPGRILSITAEEDAVHYADREAGVMPEDIEHAIL